MNSAAFVNDYVYPGSVVVSSVFDTDLDTQDGSGASPFRPNPWAKASSSDDEIDSANLAHIAESSISRLVALSHFANDDEFSGDRCGVSDDWRKRIFDLVQYFLATDNDDQDNQSEYSVSRETCEAATQFFARFVHEMKQPTISPDGDGGLIIYWRDDLTHITVDGWSIYASTGMGTDHAIYLNNIAINLNIFRNLSLSLSPRPCRRGPMVAPIEQICDNETLCRYIDAPDKYQHDDLIEENVFRFMQDAATGRRRECVAWRKYARSDEDVHRLGLAFVEGKRNRKPPGAIISYIGFTETLSQIIRNINEGGYGLELIHVPNEGLHHVELYIIDPVGSECLREDAPKSQRNSIKLRVTEIFKKNLVRHHN